MALFKHLLGVIVFGKNVEALTCTTRTKWARDAELKWAVVACNFTAYGGLDEADSGCTQYFSGFPRSMKCGASKMIQEDAAVTFIVRGEGVLPDGACKLVRADMSQETICASDSHKSKCSVTKCEMSAEEEQTMQEEERNIRTRLLDLAKQQAPLAAEAKKIDLFAHRKRGKKKKSTHDVKKAKDHVKTKEKVKTAKDQVKAAKDKVMANDDKAKDGVKPKDDVKATDKVMAKEKVKDEEDISYDLISF